MIALAAIHSHPAFTPLALLYLRAQLAEHGGVPAGDVDIAEFALDTPPAHIARRILRSSPRIAAPCFR